MGKPEQAVDAGFHLDTSIEWLVADLILPKSEDQEALRKPGLVLFCLFVGDVL